MLVSKATSIQSSALGCKPARKGGADVMIQLLQMGGVSATEKAPYTISLSKHTPIEIAIERTSLK